LNTSIQERAVAKQLGKLDRGDARRLTPFLRDRLALLDDPRTAGKALHGPLGALWRYRVGDYRLLATIEDDVLRVLVVRSGRTIAGARVS